MKKTVLATAVLALAAASAGVRARTRDISYNLRMPAGFPGDVNRTHPASILPGLTNPTNPPRLFGDAVLIDTATNSYRALLAGDTAITKVDGILVRPYPTQQQSGGMAASIGAAPGPLGNQVCDVLNEGFIIARCNNFAAQQPTKGGAVYIWVAASSGAHVQGGFESVTSAGNTAGPITNLKWNGPTDGNGITEIQIAAPLA
ncbi:hypothetical protein ZHS_12 [Edwardsiella phage vB_EpM_ZHS]|jgi:hypothetical protein|nr:hypothetical protein ZHS_12 [Edwardsiella phage vB_EpM_ZHS]